MNTKITTIFSLRSLSVVVLLGALCILIGLPAMASADDTSQNPKTGEVLLYCQSVVKNSKAKSACTTTTQTWARNVASYHCTDQPIAGNKKESCITDKAKSYMKSAAASNPKSADDFRSSLNAVLKKATGDKTKPSPDSDVSSTESYSLGSSDAKYSCGAPGADQIDISINIGCVHKGPAMLDATFAIIRFLSDGAGLIMIGSLVWGGIQFSISRSDPQATAAATNRLRTVIISLLIYIFAYAILNFLIPGQLLQ